MPDHPTYAPLREGFRHPAEAPARRTIVRAVVTELAAALEPVERDPFLDGVREVARLRPVAPTRGRLAGTWCR